MKKLAILFAFAVLTGATTGAGLAQTDKQTAAATIPTPETCKPICAKAKDVDLTDEKEQTAYRECFIKRLCEAGRIIYPLAKENPPANFLEMLLGSGREYKG